jgi:PAS domain S-box-containing protein
MGEKDKKEKKLTEKSSDQTESKDLRQRKDELGEVESRLQQEITERKRAEEEAQRRAVQARLIYEVGQRMSSELELEELFSAIVYAISDAFGYYSVILAPVDEELNCLTIGAIVGGFADIFPKDYKIPVGEGMTGYAAATGEIQLSGDVSQDPHFLPIANEKTLSELVVPIKSGAKVIGVLDLQSEEYNAFDQTDVMLMESLADQIAVAMENARLYEQAQMEISERMRVELELRKHQEHLEELVDERTAELKASVERYRTLFDGVPVGLYRTTPAGQFLDANLALVEMYGYPDRKELLATRLTDVYADPDERVHWMVLMEDQGIVRDFEACVKRHDGTMIWVNDTARVVKDEQGDVLYYEGSQENITERKYAEEKLREYQEHLEELVAERTIELQASEERYRTLFDGVPISLYRTTPDGQVLDTNLAMVQLAGFPSRDEILQTRTTSLYVDPEDRARWQVLMEENGVVRDFEARIKRYDGTLIWVNDTARVVKDEQENVLYYEGSLEDITKRKEFEEEIRRQKDYFEALFVNSPVAIVTADLDANVVSWNPKAEELFGYSQEEAVDRNVDELVANDPSILEEALDYTDQVSKTERVQVSTRRTRKDGSFVDVELLGLPLILAGEKVGFYAIYHDISELMRVERELRQQKDYFEALFVNSPVAIVIADRDANVVSWNPRAEKLFGYNQAEAVGRNVDELVANDPSIIEEALDYTDQVSKIGRVQASTKRTHKDGSFVDVELLGLPLVLAGENVGTYAMYHDISELKRIERELRQQKDYFEALFVNSPVAIVSGDLETRVVSWNPMAEKMFGYSQEEAIGKHIDELVAIDPEIQEAAHTFTQELLTTDRLKWTGRRNRKDGTQVDVEALVLPTFVAGDKVGYIGIYYDISELLQARREAETANQAKSIFLANMSHELRTPLNAILGFTQLMDGNPNLTLGQQENLEIINHSGEHLLALINDVLEMSKIEAGQVELRETTFDLYNLLDNLEEMFRFQAENKGLDLSFQLAENVPRYVISDESKLRQVLNNLIGNAVKFTLEGRVELIVTTLPRSSERLELHFDVHDTGPGIPPDDLEAVFDPFVQAADITDSMATQAPDGTGLGLSISRQFVHLMGGDITARSELGVGSHFSFSVIVGVADVDEVATTQSKREVLALAPGQPVFRLLVVEDRETNRRLLVKLLERVGFEVQEATNGQEAIDTWQRWNPDLIWMDMRMPVLNGREATLKIKSLPGGQSVPIIALTATAFDEDREQILLDGCDDFVRKPFRKYEIFDILVKHLGVQFIYQEEPDQKIGVEDIRVVMPFPESRVVEALPSDWIEELRQATARADLYRILELIEQIREQSPDLADMLVNLAERYEYQKILDLTEGIGGNG